MTDAVNVWDYERLAAERLDPAVLGYFAGGSGDERTLRDNVDAFTRARLRPRVLCDVTDVSTATTVLGTEVSMPLLVAPFALQKLLHPEGELATARGSAAVGTLLCLSTITTVPPAEVAAAAPGAPRWFQVYVLRDRGRTEELVHAAADAGFSALVLTADTQYLGRRERDVRLGFDIPNHLAVPDFGSFSPAVSWRDVEELTSRTGLPVIVKGVLTAEDAQLACEHGAAGVVVSNHGGRQLDGVPATLDALPEVVEAVDGRIEVYLDGGIRRGVDVLVALALGARACFSGRAVAWALAVDGEQGVRHVLELLHDEIHLGLALLGCSSPAELTPAHVSL